MEKPIRTFNLGFEPNGEKPGTSKNFLELKEAISTAKSQVVRVFNTYHRMAHGQIVYILSTTSKDIHLELGTLSEEGLGSLCMFLGDEFRSEESSSLLLYADKQYKGDFAILVTCAREDASGRTFHLSPARR